MRSPTSGSAGTSSSSSSPYAPPHRGGGVGRALHDALLDGLPHRRALLGTWPDDRPARRLYERAGWRNLAPIGADSTLMGFELPG